MNSYVDLCFSNDGDQQEANLSILFAYLYKLNLELFNINKINLTK